jgi:uncharacterized damage-inducible protein DinB
MSLKLEFAELVGYTDGEREKWRSWFSGQPAAAWSVPVQREGRFVDVWALVDHIFIVERRHLQRLRGTLPLSDSTGVAAGDAARLWHYGEDARRDLRALGAELTDADATTARTILVRDTQYRMTPRKLLFHILIHEVRHWGQIATAVRNAGYPPPGDHDLFYSDALA